MKMYALYDRQRGKFFDPNETGERAFSKKPVELKSDRRRQVILARTRGRRDHWRQMNVPRPRLQVREIDVTVPQDED